MSNETTNKVEVPSIEKFYIKDQSNLLGAFLKDGEYCKKYPLFVMGNDNRFHINYNGVMEKFMNMKDVLIEIEFGVGEYSGAYGTYKPENLYVHVAGTELEAIERYSGGRDHDGSDCKSVMRIRACDIDNLRFAHVTVVKADSINYKTYEEIEKEEENNNG
jgi:hypothetical protein